MPRIFFQKKFCVIGELPELCRSDNWGFTKSWWGWILMWLKKTFGKNGGVRNNIFWFCVSLVGMWRVFVYGNCYYVYQKTEFVKITWEELSDFILSALFFVVGFFVTGFFITMGFAWSFTAFASAKFEDYLHSSAFFMAAIAIYRFTNWIRNIFK